MAHVFSILLDGGMLCFVRYSGGVMARRKEGGIELIASMPWQVGIVLGLFAFFSIRYGIGWYLSSSQSPLFAAMGHQMAAGAYTPFAWLALFACWLGALLSYFSHHKRKRLLDTQTGLDSIRAMSWKEFELLVGEAFRRQGYTVAETGLGGADGGIDLILRKDGTAILVQCKQWRTRQVTVNVVREMFGLLTHHGAQAVKIVATGDYTADAKRFALGKPIELIQGDELLALIRSVQTVRPEATPSAPSSLSTDPTAPTASSPPCPKCGTAMVQRENRRTRERFWGCPGYPACRGTRVT